MVEKRDVNQRPRILVVDDEELIVTVIGRMLAADFDVTATTHAEEALRRVRAGERFDAVVCDLMMPEMSGMALFEELQHEAPGLATRTVFLSGGVFKPEVRDFLDRVPNECLDKPFDAAGLRATLRRVLALPVARGGLASHL